MSKATEAKAKPGLKQLTPYEKAMVDKMKAGVKAMWLSLLGRNKWRPTK
jgi:hypothetical protein